MLNLSATARGALMLSAFLAASAPALAFQDPTEVPAARSERMLTSPMTAVTTVGTKTIAVGQRGHIAISEDNGQSWRQAQVPVSSDLVAVSFPSETHGWAVGHGGVVLHSADGGETWQKQLDGQDAIGLVKDYYSPSGPGGREVEEAAMYHEREEILVSYGGTQALMAVHFLNEREGFVGGLFNRLFHTTDGGVTWQPWQHRIDNPMELHFYGITADDEAVYITGEMGMVWRMRHGEEHFVERPTGYDGTLFGSISNGRSLVAFGMRGSVYRSADAGDSWTRVDLGTNAGITSGAVLPGGVMLLGALSGEVVRSGDGGRSFQSLQLDRSMPYFGLAARADGQLTLVGAAGVQQEALAVDVKTDTDKSAVVKNAGTSMIKQWGSSYGYTN